MLEDSIQGYLSDTENLAYITTISRDTPSEWYRNFLKLINHFKMKGVIPCKVVTPINDMC